MVMSARFALGLLLLITPATATYSIVGADSADMLAGVSIATCIGNRHLYDAVRIAHGPVSFGAVAAQADIDRPLFRGRDRAQELLRQDKSADAIIEAITNASFDEKWSHRQYGIAEIGSEGRSSSVAWTGSDTIHWSGGISGSTVTGSMRFAAQGNILTGPGVVSQSAAGFREEPRTRIGRVRRASGFLATHANTTMAQEEECVDLPARLMRALRRGADNGEGDWRCTTLEPPVPANTAYIRVDLPSGEPWLLISVPGTHPRSAVEMLYEEYLLWRADNPCEGGVGLAAFRANATAREVAKEALRRLEKQAEESFRDLGTSGLII